jgi:hypothetical protein
LTSLSPHKRMLAPDRSVALRMLRRPPSLALAD